MRQLYDVLSTQTTAVEDYASQCSGSSDLERERESLSEHAHTHNVRPRAYRLLKEERVASSPGSPLHEKRGGAWYAKSREVRHY